MNRIGFIRRAIYSLKRDYGAPMELYTRASSEVDLETGAKAVQLTRFAISRAILLPKQIVREQLALLGAGAGFKYGGLVDQGRRAIIVDMRDYPSSYSARPNDYAVISNRRFNIKEVSQFDHGLAVVILAEETPGEPTGGIITRALSHQLGLGSNLTRTATLHLSASDSLALADELEAT